MRSLRGVGTKIPLHRSVLDILQGERDVVVVMVSQMTGA